MDMTYDVIIIGSGPGGYVCALRAAQLGLKVACVEKRATLGGTCLNIGCIPSKTLLHSSHLFHVARHAFVVHGIRGGDGLTVDLAVMMARKNKTVEGLTKGIATLFRKHGIEHVVGSGQLLGAGRVQVGTRTLTAGALVLATGAEPIRLPGVPVDEEHIVTSTGALSLTAVPKRLAIIGAGAIGLELGSVWQRLGAHVTVIEYCDHILPPMDGEVRQYMQRLLERQGLVFRLRHKVAVAERVEKSVVLTVESLLSSRMEELAFDAVLVAVGRRPFTDGLNLAEVGVTCNAQGFIVVDHHFCTSTAGIYAIGDVIGGTMLAHKAAEEGIAVAERLAGQAGYVNYEAIPSVVYTWPEVAAVGQNEEALQAAGTTYKVGRFPFTANARAHCSGESDGFVKILVDAYTDRLLGAHIIGPQAGELIAEIVLGAEFSTSAEDIARTSHAHPSLAEAVREAALAVGAGALHL
ncbi:Dihydrolipoamide dehydrogenase of 2-oxoglutarate dehydrogenase [invertebrate metagenome]|uniref:Dihydrolipoamide dehydrogenase of 2-oxoglutarate dehydrogenase n=1 Tax=invertebrate metagenome TaxID=1711999 RepID=A0A484H4V7_9ZZZZ